MIQPEALKPRRLGRHGNSELLPERLTDDERLELAELEREHRRDGYRTRPVQRGDCKPGAGGAHEQRPCRFIACKFHLAVDLGPGGRRVRLNFPGIELDEMPETCALDVADRGGLGASATASLLNITVQALNLIETRAIRNRNVKIIARKLNGGRD